MGERLNAHLLEIKEQHSRVYGITSGNYGINSPNLCRQFGKKSRPGEENVWWSFIHTHAGACTYVRVNLHIRPCRPMRTYVWIHASIATLDGTDFKNDRR